MRDKEKQTQEQIGKRIGWSREKVRDYNRVIDNIGAEILNIAKAVQIGRATDNGANAPINFTEGGLRDINH